MTGKKGQGLSRREAWAVLRRLVEASRTDIVRLLWPDGDSSAPAQVERVVSALGKGNGSLPPALRGLTPARSALVLRRAREDLEWASVHHWRLITPDDDEWPTMRLDEAFNCIGDLDTAEPADDGDTAPGPRGAEAGARQGVTASDAPETGVRRSAARPFALWGLGPAQLSGTVERSVAVVGTRSSTTYGERTTHRFAGELAAAGYTVVSGGALGTDTAAHRGALEADGSTVMVAACGPGVVYPQSNADLFRQIAGTGLLVTEYPPGTTPARYRFLTRNRLVAALTRGTFLAAAGYRSGAVNTANWADAMLRPVMVLPGPVDSAAFVGCHRRIRDGAGTLVTRSSEIREIIEPLGSVDCDGQLDLEFTASPVQQLSRDQLSVFDCCGIVSDDTGRIEQIAGQTGLPPVAVVRTLRELENIGLIVRSGDRWLKNDR